MEKEQNVIPVNLDFNAKIHNRFDIEVHDAKTGEVKQRAQAFNVICDALWTRMFSGSYYFNYIIYGSGTGTPAATDTTLFQKINAIEAYYTNNVITDQFDDSIPENTIYNMTKRVIIDTETSNGSTIREVGIGYDATHIVTHAMLQDMNGNPVSITKTNTDIIYIYATIYVHYAALPPLRDILIVGNNTSSKPESSLCGAITGYSFGSSDTIRYSNGNFIYSDNAISATISKNTSTKTIICSARILADQANLSNGIITLSFLSNIILDVKQVFNLSSFAITGENIGSGNGTTSSFKSKFPINSSAKVYIDGVEQLSGVTINTGAFKEFYKLRKIYNTSGHLVYPSLDTSVANKIIENDINATFTEFKFVKGDENTFSCYVYGSDTFNGPWTSLGSLVYVSGTGTKTITFPNPTNYRYYKITYNLGSYYGTRITSAFLVSPSDNTYNVVFDTPPAAGSVITIDYIPDCIPKDSNHVLDLTLSLTLGEYSGN